MLCSCSIRWFLLYCIPGHTLTLQALPAEGVWHVKGAMDVVLRQCSSLPDGSPLTSIDKEHFTNAAHELGMRGLRGQRSVVTKDCLIGCILLAVVAMATGPQLSQLSFVGLVGMWDPPRPRVGMAVSILMESGVSVKMITGDARDTGEAIGGCGSGHSH